MGPYVVVRQNTFSSVVLKGPATGLMVDNGADIPLEQIWRDPSEGGCSLSRVEEIAALAT
eukprot:11068372-Karenia_brevis.AAC.1